MWHNSNHIQQTLSYILTHRVQEILQVLREDRLLVVTITNRLWEQWCGSCWLDKQSSRRHSTYYHRIAAHDDYKLHDRYFVLMMKWGCKNTYPQLYANTTFYALENINNLWSALLYMCRFTMTLKNLLLITNISKKHQLTGNYVFILFCNRKELYNGSRARLFYWLSWMVLGYATCIMFHFPAILYQMGNHVMRHFLTDCHIS